MANASKPVGLKNTGDKTEPICNANGSGIASLGKPTG